MPLFENLDRLEPAEAVYKMLKAERRTRRIALALKIAIVAAAYLYYQHLQLPQNAAEKQALVNAAQTKIEAFVTPIVERTAANLTKKLQAQMEAEMSSAASNVLKKVTKGGASGPAVSADQAEVAAAAAEIAKDPSKLDPQTVDAIMEALKKK